MTAKKEPKKDLAALLAEEAEAAELNPDAPITEATTVTRGHGRSKTLQIRLNPEELEELERVAASRGLPTSTVAREAILRLIRPAQLRSADARRLVESFARYVDSLDAPAPSGVYTVSPRSTGLTVGRLAAAGMVMNPPHHLVDVAFPGDLVPGGVVMAHDPTRTLEDEAENLFEVGSRLIRRAEELRERSEHREQTEFQSG